MSKKGQLWTSDEEKEMLDLLRRGTSFEAIAREHERTVKAIQWRWGMYCRRKIQRGETDQARLAREFHTDPMILNQILSQMEENQVKKSIQPREEMNQLEERLDKMYDLLLKIAKNQKKLLVQNRVK